METICHHLLSSRNRKNTAIEFIQNRKWKTKTWPEYFEYIQSCAAGLKALGIERGDRIVLISNTRVEWAALDLAIMGMGGVTVPIYHNSHFQDMEYIIQEVEPRVIFFESQDIERRYQKFSEGLSFQPLYVSIDFEKEGILSWKEFLENGSASLQESPAFFETSCLNTQIEDLATIVYTSGTTGTPKGVCLHHEQIMSEVSEVFRVIDIDERDKSLTFLPYAHILGRLEHWAHIYKGFTMAFAESVERVRLNLQVARPTFLIAVPRIFEKIFSSIQVQTQVSPIKSKMFHWAMSIGYKISESRLRKKSLDLVTLMEYRIAKRLIFDKLYEKLGGRLRFAISGGAPLSEEIIRFFHASGLLILEGYGLTETTAAVTVNTPYHYKFGTVGRAIGEVKIKIAEDGEILLHSKKNMKGYYKNPEATRDVFDDQDYFKTGDIGELDAQGFLKITDRKKDLIKTAGGKFIAPQKIENLLKQSPYISYVHVHGDKKKYIVVLVTLNFEALKGFIKEQGLEGENPEQLVQSSRVKDLIRDVIAQTNTTLSSFETIKNFAILADEFSVETGELTPSLKVKRKFCDEKYEQILQGLYGESV